MNSLLVNVSFGAQVELCRYKMRYKPNSKWTGVHIGHGAKKKLCVDVQIDSPKRDFL